MADGAPRRRRRPRRLLLLFTAAGLVALNNVEFGIGAFAATFAAVACHELPASSRAVPRLLLNAAGGLAAAVLLVCGLTLMRTGALPRFPLLLEFPRLYGNDGWVLEPMSPMGLHVAFYITFAAAITTAAVRAARGGEEPVLTSMLAWSGVFGLIAGSYYAGRSDTLNLVALMSAWSLALTLLLIVVVRAIVARATPRTLLPEVAVVFGFCIAACSVVQVPAPWSEIARLRHGAGKRIYEQRAATAVIAAATVPGERVVILLPLGYRIAYDLGLENLAPYASIEAMPTVRQMQTTADVARRAHVHKIFVARDSTLPEQLRVLVRAGYTPVRGSSHRNTVELTDRDRA